MSSTLLAVLLTSCADNTELPTTAFVGEWEWVISSGGFDGGTLTPDSVGYTRLLSVDEASADMFIQDSLVRSYPYEINEILVGSNNAPDTLIVSVPALLWTRATVIADTLRIWAACSDCYSHMYVQR